MLKNQRSRFKNQLSNLHQILILFVLIFPSGLSFAQSDVGCSETLLNANKLYEQGLLSEAIELALPCSQETAPVSDRWKAHRLLAMVYLASSNNDLAKKSAEEMLELNPTYQTSSLNDPTELIKLLNSILLIPKLSFGLALSMGTNSTFPSITKEYIVADYNKTYTAKNSYLFGASVEYHFNEKFSLTGGLYSVNNKYNIDYKFNNWSVNVSNKLNYLNMPVMLEYALSPRIFGQKIRPTSGMWIPQKKLKVTLQAGVFGGRLLYSNSDFKSTYFPDNPIIEITENTLTNINTLSSRNSYQFGFITGIATSYEVGHGNLFLKMNFSKSLSNITKQSNRYNYTELSNDFYYLDDNVYLRSASISLGYSFYMNYQVIRK
ncbi:MAG: hypothetical protein EXR20_07365 [Bacteroidetes bacterium]|nr:hypothetical protein [Bacteroidota bacterium]